MKDIRGKFRSGFKTKVVLGGLNGRRTLSERLQKYEILFSQIARWKREFIEADNVFDQSFGNTGLPPVKPMPAMYELHF